MKRKRFTDEQILAVLRKFKRAKEAETICREYGISRATLYNWRNKYKDHDNHEELKTLQKENIRLKEMYVELMLEYQLNRK